MYRVGLFASVLVVLLVAVAPGGDDKDKKPGVKKPDPMKPPPPKVFVVSAELKDGTILQVEMLATQTVTIRTAELDRLLVFKADAVRFVDLEGTPHRVVTHNFDTIYGMVVTNQFQVKVAGMQEKIGLEPVKLKRLLFPEPIRVLTIP